MPGIDSKILSEKFNHLAEDTATLSKIEAEESHIDKHLSNFFKASAKFFYLAFRFKTAVEDNTPAPELRKHRTLLNEKIDIVKKAVAIATETSFGHRTNTPPQLKAQYNQLFILTNKFLKEKNSVIAKKTLDKIVVLVKLTGGEFIKNREKLSAKFHKLEEVQESRIERDFYGDTKGKAARSF